MRKLLLLQSYDNLYSLRCLVYVINWHRCMFLVYVVTHIIGRRSDHRLTFWSSVNFHPLANRLLQSTSPAGNKITQNKIWQMQKNMWLMQKYVINMKKIWLMCKWFDKCEKICDKCTHKNDLINAKKMW